MKKYYLLLAAGALGCALASLPVLASDAPTDKGNYIWQDENGDFCMTLRNTFPISG